MSKTNNTSSFSEEHNNMMFLFTKQLAPIPDKEK